MAELRKQCHFDEQTKVVLFAGRLRRDKGVVKLVEALVALQTIFPNVVLEALAMMLPVITTDAVGAVDSVVDGETGFIVSVRNLEDSKSKCDGSWRTNRSVKHSAKTVADGLPRNSSRRSFGIACMRFIWRRQTDKT